MQSIQQPTPARYPGLSIEHGDPPVRQASPLRRQPPRPVKTTLRDQAGRYRTVSIISLYAWEA
jgi:hypothetical protein